ncbi:MAG: hypothetical protein P4L22_03235 [Candidatus Babeliales bacterium]|nr:hypothetical protein [Candidatus Babeliales bacterium]
MNMKKMAIILGLLACSNQFASEMKDVEIEDCCEKRLIKEINENKDNPSQLGSLLIELGSYYYLNGQFEKANKNLEAGIQLAVDNKLAISAYLTLGKMFFYKHCKLSDHDKLKFSWNFDTHQGKFVPNGKTEMDQAKFYFELVCESHNYFRIKNCLNPGHNDCETSVENIIAKFFLAQIYYDVFYKNNNCQERLNLSNKINELIFTILNDRHLNSALNVKELNLIKNIQKKLPKLKKSSSGNHLDIYS